MSAQVNNVIFWLAFYYAVTFVVAIVRSVWDWNYYEHEPVLSYIWTRMKTWLLGPLGLAIIVAGIYFLDPFMKWVENTGSIFWPFVMIIVAFGGVSAFICAMFMPIASAALSHLELD